MNFFVLKSPKDGDLVTKTCTRVQA